jgi:uncharacterized membrane protein/protein-disulfide isomerase
MSARTRWIVRFFALTGLGFSGAATWVHYRLLTDPTYISACDINSTFSCSHLYLSPYGSVRGVPVAVGGVVYFVLVSLLAWLGPAPNPAAPPSSGGKGAKAAEPQPADSTGGYLFVLATIGLASILYLGFASYKMHTVCVLCVGTYVSVIGIFVTTGLSTTGRIGRLPLRLLEDLRNMTAKPAALLVSILFIAGTGYAAAFFPAYVEGKQAAPAPAQELSKDAETAFRQAWAAQPRIDLGIPAGGAKVVVVKFNDWLCGACKGWHQQYLPAIEPYLPTLDSSSKAASGAVKYVVKDWVWNNRCNPFTQTLGGHEGACEAAAAVRMARDRGKTEVMIKWLFDNQERLIQSALGAPASMGASNASSTAIRAQAMTLLGITQAEFDREYAQKLVDIKRDESDGQALGVSSTPVYYVNGVRTTSPPPESRNLPPPYFELAIKIELGKPAGK